MDSSFRTSYRAQQASLATAMLPSLMKRLREGPRHEVREFLPIETSDMEGVDEDAYWTLVETETNIALISAVQTCIDYWCTQVVRSRSYRSRAFALWNAPETIELLAGKAGVKQRIIQFVYVRIREQGGIIPPLGKLKVGRLMPDRASLVQWRELYDWTEQATSGSTAAQ